MNKSEREIIPREIRAETKYDYVTLGYVDTYIVPLGNGKYDIIPLHEKKTFTWEFPEDKIKKIQVNMSGIWVTCKSDKINKIKEGDTLTIFWTKGKVATCTNSE